MVDYYGSTVGQGDTSLDSGFLDFTEEEKKRFEILGYDVAKIESALRDGSATKEDLLEVADWKESQQVESVSREVQREEADMPVPPSRIRPYHVDYQDVPQQQKGFSWDNFFSTNTGPIDAAVGAASDAGEFFGSIAGHGVEMLGRATNSPLLYKTGKFMKEQATGLSHSFKDWGMDEEAKADAMGPRSIFTYDKPDDWMPSGMGNFNLGTITQLFSSALATSGGLLLPAKMIAKKLIKQGMSSKKAGMLGMGLTAGGAEGTMASSDAYDGVIEFASSNPEGVKNSPIYNVTRQKILSKFPDANEKDLFNFIVDEIAESAAMQAGLSSGAVVGLTSIPMAGFLDKVGFWGKGAKKFDGVKKPWGEVIFKGMGTESVEEGFQEGFVQLASNYAEYVSGKSPDMVSGKGVAEASAAGIVGGGMTGPLFTSYSNIGMMSQEELDANRLTLMHEWSQVEQDVLGQYPYPGEEERGKRETASFTTPGSKTYIGERLEELGLEFEEGDTFETVANKNKIDLEAVKNIQKVMDLAEKEREGLPQGADPYAGKVDEEEIIPEEKEEPKEGLTKEDKALEKRLAALKELEKFIFTNTIKGSDNVINGKWKEIVEGTINPDITSQFKGQGLKGFTKANMALEGGFFEAIVKANNLEKHFPKYFKGEPAVKESAVVVGRDRVKEIKDTSPEFKRLEKITKEKKEAHKASQKKYEDFFEKHPELGTREEILKSKDKDLVAEYNKVVEDLDVADKALKAAEQDALNLSAKGKDISGLILTDAERNSLKKGITALETHSTRVMNRLKDIKSGKDKKTKGYDKQGKADVTKSLLKQLDDWRGTIQEKKEKLEAHSKAVSVKETTTPTAPTAPTGKLTFKNKEDKKEYNSANSSLTMHKNNLKAMQTNLGKAKDPAKIKEIKDKIAEKKKKITEAEARVKKATAKGTVAEVEAKPEAKEIVVDQKDISTALSIVQNFTKKSLHEKKHKYSKGALQNLNEKLGIKKDTKDLRPAVIDQLFNWVKQYKKANPSAVDKATEDFKKRVAAASTGEGGKLDIREIMTVPDMYALVSDEKFVRLKKVYLERLEHLRGKKKQTPEDMAYMQKWEKALLDTSGRAGIAEVKRINPVTNKEEIEHKVVWYGSEDARRMKQRHKAWALSRIRKVTNTMYDIPQLFALTTHENSEVRELAKLILSYSTPNETQLDIFFANLSKGTITQSVFGGKDGGLPDPLSVFNQQEINLMYTRILNAIDAAMQGKEVFMDTRQATGVDEFDVRYKDKGLWKNKPTVPDITTEGVRRGLLYKGPGSSGLTLDDKHQLDTLRWHAIRLYKDHNAKRIVYRKFASDEHYIKNFEKATRILVGDPDKGGGSIRNAKKRINDYIKKRAETLEKFKNEQYGKANSKTDDLTMKEAEKAIKLMDSNLAKDIEAELNKEMPGIITAYERYYEALRLDGFDVRNLKPNLWEDFTEAEFKEESNKVKQARRGMKEKLNALFDGTQFVGRAGLFSKTGYATSTEEKDILSSLITQQISGEGDEILTPFDYQSINDHYKVIDQTGYEKSMNLERLRNLGFRPYDYDPEKDWGENHWNKVWRRKPVYDLYTDKDGSPIYDYDGITDDHEEYELLMAMKEAGYPLRKYTIVKVPMGKDPKTDKRLFREERVPVVKKDTNGNDMYEMEHARVFIPETTTIITKVYQEDKATGKVKKDKDGSPVYVWQTKEVFTGRADPNAPFDYERRYKIRHLKGSKTGVGKNAVANKEGKEEFVLLKDLPNDKLVRDIYVDKADEEKVNRIIEEFGDVKTAAERDRRDSRINEVLKDRKEIKKVVEQVLDKEETKKRGYEVFKEVESGVSIPLNEYRHTYEKITSKVPLKNAKGEDAVDSRGRKMYSEEWESEFVTNAEGVQKPLMRYVYEERDEFIEAEHPFETIKGLSPEEKAIALKKHGEKKNQASKTHWGVIFGMNADMDHYLVRTGYKRTWEGNILEHFRTKEDMTDYEIDAYTKSFYRKDRLKRKKNTIASRDYYNRLVTNKVLDFSHTEEFAKDKDGEKTGERVKRTDFGDNAVLKDVIHRLDPNGKILGAYVKSRDSEGREVLKKVSPSLAQTMESGILNHPQTGKPYPTYQSHALGSESYPGNLAWEDDPVKHISLEVRTNGDTREIQVIAEDGSMEGDLVGVIVLVKDADGREKISLTHFDTAAVANARLTVEEVDKLIGHSLGVYVADQPQFYTGVDPFATQWGVKKYLQKPRRGEEGYEDFIKPTPEDIRIKESLAPPVIQPGIGEAPLTRHNDANLPFPDKKRPHIFNRTTGGMTESAREAFAQARHTAQMSGIEAGFTEDNKLVSLKPGSEPMSYTVVSEFKTTTTDIDPKSGERYVMGSAVYGGEMGMDLLELPTSEKITEAVKMYKKMMKKKVKVTKTKKGGIDVQVVSDKAIQKAAMAKGKEETPKEIDLKEDIAAEEEIEETEKEDVISKGEAALISKENLALIEMGKKMLSDAHVAYELVESGGKPTEQQRMMHRIFSTFKDVPLDEHLVGKIGTFLTGESENQANEDDILKSDIPEEGGNKGVGTSVDDVNKGVTKDDKVNCKIGFNR